ncbi:Rne/Rng family ribonuclease [Nesterenkonia sp. MY13]|uniref:Ribonuclease E n=1 Tax=Nesterenkonia sedimenti TaxID=1463632 RepID=A0A7X8TH65_9MICC|nr:Rne/Rng family ribonuclease [Nesterenkonia sedimenti]NLS08616.1 Rne/Rng family ribonuclease [Nesterenkonia sedimenti]
MTDTTASTNEPEEIFNPFSAPEPGQPGAEATIDKPADTAPVDADPLDVTFQAPDLSKLPARSQRPQQSESQDTSDDADQDGEDDSGQGSGNDDDGDSSGNRRNRRKRRRGGRSRNKSQDNQDNGQNQENSQKENEGSADSEKSNDSEDADQAEDKDKSSAAEKTDDGQVIRKKRRRRRGTADMEIEEDSEDGHTVTRIRSGREAGSDAPAKVTGVKGSTRLEAKRQRRRASRDGGRRRGVITEAEFLARRESVDRKMIVRQRGERIQIGVLEDGVLAEHYVSHTTQDSLIGNVYLGKVQNVLPSMEAAFVDIGRGRNAVLYAGEVDWEGANIGNAPRKIENALKSGDSVLVQVTKDPVGHKGARLTSQVSLPGRYLVFVPGGSMTGISRKLPDTERSRLKKILKEQMPENAGVIVRTAAEGASEEELTNDINRLRALWETIQSQANDRKVLAPELLYAEPDLTIKVVRDVFNEDFSAMEVQGEETWDDIEAYVTYVAPHLLDRCKKWEPQENQAEDIFAHHRIDEQLNKALDRNVKLPSGGSLVFDRTEAMTVVDVNTGKFTGSGGNLEETVTKNNLEAAEEIVRQLRLRDIGGIIVIDFIDMVLESNRDLVLRRMVECLGRDRTKHQVAEVTSLGLVQMTRKRMGTGLLEVFSTECEHCAGRGIMTHPEPVEHRPSYTSEGDVASGKNAKKRKKKNRKNDDAGSNNQPDPKELKKLEKASKGMAKVAAATNGQHKGEESDQDQAPAEQKPARQQKQQSKQQKSATLTIGGEPVELPEKKDSGSAPEKEEGGKPASLDQLETALATRSKRRGRRAAGSAQGSSGEVTQVNTEVQGGEKTFASSSGTSGKAKQDSTEPAAEPVMLGVGVSADELAQSKSTE